MVLQHKYILVLVLALCAIAGIMLVTMPVEDRQVAEAHKAFVGDAVAASKPYNVLDYTKPSH